MERTRIDIYGGFFSVTPLKKRGAGGVMNSRSRLITAAKSNSLTPSYVRGITPKFRNESVKSDGHFEIF